MTVFRFKMRGGTAAAITTLNEVPLARELVFETDTLKFKLGNGTSNWASLGYVMTDVTISLSDVTTNNATTSRHGFLPKLSNVATEFLNGQGNFTTPGGGGFSIGLALQLPHLPTVL